MDKKKMKIECLDIIRMKNEKGIYTEEMNEEITITCDGKERVGMSTIGMDINQYIEEGEKENE